MARISNAQIHDELNQTRSLLAEVVGMLGGQHATPAPVAEAVTDTAKPEATPEPQPEPTASDKLLAYVAEQGLAFARGGRTYMDTESLKASVRVLKTGKPEILSYSDGSVLRKRGVSHIAIGRSDDGQSVFTQFCYTPEA